MAIVVSDTSPIRALGHLGLIGLLEDLYSQVFLPPAVDAELKYPRSGSIAVFAVEFPFLQVRAPIDADVVGRFSETLDRGEAEALALALELRADLVLIDEALGRAEARRCGLTPVGVLGTLVRAKQNGSIAAVTPLIDRLQTGLGFFISPALKAEILRIAGEGG